MKTAILQVADTGPLESLVVMLRSAGYRCILPSASLKDEIRSLGCDVVYDIDHLVKHWGYERPFDLVQTDRMDDADLYVDVKAHRSGPKIWRRWPRLENRTLWYRINGGKPEHVVRADGFDCGDEVNPPCPILTPNQWYSPLIAEINGVGGPVGNSYVCWPPFVRFDEFARWKRPGEGTNDRRYSPPICLIHNLTGWGYGALIENARRLGVRCHGVGSPDGLVDHKEIGPRLSKALAMVHLKSNDAPGYALYEAMAAGCPVVCTRRLIWRCRMQELLIPGETCLVFDRETHDALSQEDVATCTAEIKVALEQLADRDENHRIGNAGRERLEEVMWSERRPADVASLQEWLSRMYP